MRTGKLLKTKKKNKIFSHFWSLNRSKFGNLLYNLETESSYGGGFGPESESPVFMTWQQKPVGLADDTPGGVTSSTLEISTCHCSLISFF